uniref:Protein TsetseEP domain-containing protein n=1 Tax=Anopheles farauti TaxID=69004 RepID=A0A182Q0Z9_9DIPT
MVAMLLRTVLPMLLVLGALQSTHAEPSPDFGIKNTILGSTNVIRQSTRVSATFDLVDTMNLSLTGGYALLENMKSAVLYVANKVATTGMALATAINTLAVDKSSDVNAAFNPVYGAIGALRTLLQTGFTDQYTALQEQGNSITAQLNDAFKSIQSRLTLFSAALDRMKAGVIAARDAPGNPPNAISTENLNRYVTTKLTFDLQDALAKLSADIPLVTYVVEETQRKLSIADVFLGDMRNEAQMVMDNDVKTWKGFFDTDVSSIPTSTGGQLTDNLGTVYNAQMQAIGTVQATIEALSTYTDDLKPALDSLALTLSASALNTVENAVTEAFTTYLSSVDASIAGLASIEQFFVSETCSGLRSVIDALVANSVYSNFCFSKFSPRLFNQFALSFYSVSECYDVETIRLYRLRDLLVVIVNMIIYDIEDLGEAISSCAPLGDGAACLTLIGPYYELLAITIDEKQAYLLNFLEEETNLSVQRLGSCVTTVKYMTTISVAAIIANLGTCTVNGPTPV